MQNVQGDIIIAKIKEFKGEFKAFPKNGLVVAEGEKSGHFHTVVATKPGTKMSYAKTDTGFIIKIDKGGAEIRHNKHDLHSFDEGIFYVGKQFEYDELGKYRAVKD